jgi:hypothetical protein
VAADVVARFERCPRFDQEMNRDVMTTTRTTAYGDQGWVVARRWAGPGLGPVEVLRLVRLGENLLVVHRREVHGLHLRALVTGTGQEVERLMDRQMCLLTDGGCAWRSDPDVLRPDGWGPLRLSMSRQDIEATGAAEFDDAGECTALSLESGGAGLLSASDELVRLQVPEGVATPDGISVGSSEDQVLELMPFAGQPRDGVLEGRASPTADYEVTVEGGKVTQLALSSVDDGCSG